MGKEQNQTSIQGLLGAREAIQTSTLAYVEELPHGIMTPGLEPPAALDPQGVLVLIEDLRMNPFYILELPTSMSGPTTAKRNAMYLQRAREYGVENQIAVHTRMKEQDFKLAVMSGAKRIHLFGNSSETAGLNGHAKPIKDILTEFHKIAGLAGEYGVESLRGSLEQATETDIDKIIEFIEGVKNINSYYFDIYGRNIITDIGLPDTNGVATPEKYIDILSTVGHLIKEYGLRLSIHLHDDKRSASDNAKTIIDFATESGISLLVEVAHPKYPGERSGTRPTFDDMRDLGMPGVPFSANTIVIGNSWVSESADLEDEEKRNEASHYHVAGVHTYVIENYSNGNKGYPHPGLYSIMGQGNILYLMNQLGMNYQKKDILIKQAALVARELAAQYGNLNQGYAIAYVKFIASHEDDINYIESTFGKPEEWLVKDSLPDLSYIKEQLDIMVQKTRIHQETY